MLDPQKRLEKTGLPGLLIFLDDRQAGGFYALPAAPRLAVAAGSGPEINLLLYGRKQPDGSFKPRGGMLTLTTSLEITAEEERAATAAVARWLAAAEATAQAPPRPQRLSPDWLEAAVEVRLTPEVILRGTPSLAGSNRCSFSRTLGADEARALAEAWGRGLPDASLSYRCRLRVASRGSVLSALRAASSRRTTDGETRESSSFRLESTVTPGAAPLPLELAGPLSVPAGGLAAQRREVEM